MNNILIDTIIEEAEKTNAEIKTALKTKGINDTGRASNSIHIVTEANRVMSLGIFYLEFLNSGRGKTRKSEGGVLLKRIRVWVESKLGLSGEEAERAAVLITLRIHEEGTRIKKNPAKYGIELTPKIEDLKRRLNERLGAAAKIEILEKLDRFKKVYNLNI
jgi:hypothetical protein